MSLTTECPFADLIERVAQGQDMAMGELSRQFGPALVIYCERSLKGALRARLDAEDVVQSMWITMWQGIRTGKFDVPTAEHLLALAKTLLRRQVARHWRKLKSEMDFTQSAAMIETVVDQQLIPTAAAETGPQQKAEFDELMENFLGGLSETDQALIQLRFRGHTTADAAILLRIEPGTLRVRLGRLREKFAGLRRELMGQA